MEHFYVFYINCIMMNNMKYYIYVFLYRIYLYLITKNNKKKRLYNILTYYM